MASWMWLLIYAAIAALALNLARPLIEQLKKRFLAKIIMKFADVCNKVMRERKQQLFDDALLPLKNKQNKLEVLEIGAGPGSNFDFYPPNTAVTCLEPNEFFEETLRKHVDKLDGRVILRKFILGKGEDMKEVADSSVDACVCTYVLCSVDDPHLVVEQIRRVLKPGGRFLFLEHVAAAEGTWVRFFQKLISLWHHGHNHSAHRNPIHLVQHSGFSETKVQSFDATEFMKAATNFVFRVMYRMVAPHESGYAVK